MHELIVPSNQYSIVPMVHDEKLRDDFAARLAQACSNAGIDAHGRGVVIAKKLGVTPKAVSKWLNSESMPRQGKMAELAKMLGVTVYWLQYGEDTGIGNVDLSQKIEHEYKSSFPLISSVQAGQWSEICDIIDLSDAEYLPTTEKAGKGSFWLTIEGESMLSSTGVSFPPGTRVLVDPSVEPENGKLVVAKLVDVNEATFKKLIIDSGQRFLKPLNDRFPIMPINGNCRIEGVVIDAKLKLV